MPSSQIRNSSPKLSGSASLFESCLTWLLSGAACWAVWILKTFSKNPKIQLGLKLREQKPWSDVSITDDVRGPIWFHCASGEFEYAKPVIRELKQRSPKCQILVTYFSPTMQAAIAGFPGVDFHLPIPLESVKEWSQFLDRIQPQCLLIARTDLWPVMLSMVKRHNIPILMFSATMSSASGRLNFWQRPLSRFLFGKLTEIHVVAEDDLSTMRLLELSVPISACGDTRFDQAAYRLEHPKKLPDWLTTQAPSQRSVAIAGSTWREDEAVLIPVIQETTRMQHRLQWFLVPHEPTKQHVQDLEQQLKDNEISSCRFTETKSWPEEDVVIVDTVGYLAEIYVFGKMAFIGGSFRKSVHSVMEALAAGCWTFVGPKHLNNREAIQFSSIPLLPFTKPIQLAHHSSRIDQHKPADFKMVQVVRSSEEWIQIVRSYIELRAQYPDQAALIHQQIRSQVQDRIGASKSVVEWIAAHSKL